MVESILWVILAMLACMGFVQCVTWVAVRTSRRGNKMFRVIPVGGADKNTGDQMALMFTCLQWEANPAGEYYVLYGIGLDAGQITACEELARGSGVFFVQSAAELEALLKL